MNNKTLEMSDLSLSNFQDRTRNDKREKRQSRGKISIEDGLKIFEKRLYIYIYRKCTKRQNRLFLFVHSLHRDIQTRCRRIRYIDRVEF